MLSLILTKMIDTMIILAGGLGTRLRPLTDTTPKPLLPISGKPIIEHIMIRGIEFGVSTFIFSIGYRAEQIQEYFGDGSKWGVSILYAVETEPLGTGGAVRKAANGLEKPFFLVWGDNLHDINFALMLDAFVSLNVPLLMALTERSDVEHFGVARLENSKVTGFVEKPKREDAPSSLINTGIFVVDPTILSTLPSGKCSIEKDCFEKIAPLGKIGAFVHNGQWFPTDTMEKYEFANVNFKVNFRFK